MNPEQIKIIRKTQAVLLSIDSGNPVVFNVIQYENLGLINARKIWKKDAYGNQVSVGHTYSLTNKGRRILNTTV